MYYEIPKSISLVNSYFGPTGVFLVFLVFAAFVHTFFYELVKFITKKTETELDDEIRRKLRRPVFLTIVLFGAYFSYSVSGYFLGIKNYVYRISISFLVLLWGHVGVQIVHEVIKHHDLIAKKMKMDAWRKEMLPFLEKIIFVVIGIIAIFILLKIWKLDVSPLLASAGVLGLAIAFAAKDTIANVFGGVSIFFDKTYKIGDYIYVEDQYRGEVINVGLRTTKIKTRDDIVVTIPNSIMANTSVVNESGDSKGMLRVRMPIGVTYGEDIEKVKKAVLEIAEKAKWVADDPKPRLRFRKMGESSLEFEFLFWVKDPEWRGRALSEMNGRVYKKFRKEKIKMGYVSEHNVNLNQ